MRFVTKDEVKTDNNFMRFDTVNHGVFFVDNYNRLCLKTDINIAIIITNSVGKIIAETEQFDNDDRCVTKILHNIVAIMDY